MEWKNKDGEIEKSLEVKHLQKQIKDFVETVRFEGDSYVIKNVPEFEELIRLSNLK